jgi:molybdopterin synthase sulfur carrier subunit
MAVVYIPAPLQGLAGGKASIEVEGETVRQVIDNLEKACPGIREKLANSAVAVDGEITRLGLLERVSPSSEIHFVIAIRGGS